MVYIAGGGVCLRKSGGRSAGGSEAADAEGRHRPGAESEPQRAACSARVDEAGGTRQRRLASLLPHVSADTQVSRQNVSLGSMGVSIPGIPTVVGPFNRYDFRVSGASPSLIATAYHNWKASEKQEQAGKLDYQDARDLVIRQTAGLYLDPRPPPRRWRPPNRG